MCFWVPLLALITWFHATTCNILSAVLLIIITILLQGGLLLSDNFSNRIRYCCCHKYMDFWHNLKKNVNINYKRAKYWLWKKVDGLEYRNSTVCIVQEPTGRILLAIFLWNFFSYLITGCTSRLQTLCVVSAAVNFSVLGEVNKVDQQLVTYGTHKALGMPAHAMARPWCKHSHVPSINLTSTLQDRSKMWFITGHRGIT